MKQLFTQLAIGLVCGYLIATLGWPITFAFQSLLSLVIPMSPSDSPRSFSLILQIVNLLIISVSCIVAALAPSPVSAFRRLSIVLVPSILFSLFIGISVLIFGD